MSCTANDEGTRVDCELGNPLLADAEVSSAAQILLLLRRRVHGPSGLCWLQVTFYIILATSGISLSTKHVSVTLQLET